MEFEFGEFMVSLVVSGIGFIFFRYGRKMERPPQILGGIVLMIYPYFVSGLLPLVGIGLGLIGLVYAALRLGY